MKTRSIPKTHDELITLASIALPAAEAHGEEIGLRQNTADRIRADFTAVVGASDAAAASSSQLILNEARASIANLLATRRRAMAEGRAFCAAAIDLLKIHFGRRWNPRWVEAGFSRGSLALPYDPYSLLLDLRNHFRSHPEHEVAALEIGAGRADALAAALLEATQQVLAGQQSRGTARKNRDAAMQRLAMRLRGLRAELDQLLARDDRRWYLFGFSRPIDRRQPERIEEVTVELSLPGEVQINWPPSPRAENYRVIWSIEGSSEPPVEVGLLGDARAHLRDLPRGVTLLIAISARNRAGESLPAMVRAQVP